MAPEPQDPGARLMLRFQEGDEEAFAELFRQHKSRVFALAFRYANDPAYAEDLVSETFLRVYRARKQYRPTAKFSTWLFRIAANLALNELRSRKRLSALDAPAGEDEEARELPDRGEPGPEARAEAGDRARVVAAALQALPETQRVLVLLVYYEDLSVREAAEIAGVSALGARLRLFRAREQLRKALKDLG